jgi:hypothetical protein
LRNFPRCLPFGAQVSIGTAGIKGRALKLRPPSGHISVPDDARKFLKLWNSVSDRYDIDTKGIRDGPLKGSGKRHGGDVGERRCCETAA